jgi:iron complex outermembrane receptor protein
MAFFVAFQPGCKHRWRSGLLRTPLAAAALALLAGDLLAQPAALPPVTITGTSTPGTASVGGFGDTPLARSPLQASVVTGEDLLDHGAATGLAGLTRFDASVSDAYNSEGYWTFLAIRGFTLDNRFNFRRDGLPINAETSIPLENKAAVEILKGTSGIQAGTSSPGGLVNLVVKRPEATFRSARLAWREDGTIGAGVDISQRFGQRDAYGIRLNAAYEHLDPQIRDLEGHRRLVALAGDWRIAAGTLLEAEIEHSRQSQPSTPGFSLLGDTLPRARDIDPRINLNNQPWSQPNVFDATTASLRWQQRLSDAWRFQAHLGVQRLDSDDRLAFPFGCTAEGNFDRYCSDGTFDLYDYRSDNEQRDTNALDLGVKGRLTTGGIAHELTTGVLLSRFKSRLQRQAFNPTFFPDGTPGGTGNIDGTAVVLPNAELTAENTNRDERSTEFYVRDVIALTDRWNAWLGLRHSRVHRESELTDGSEVSDYTEHFTTPWVAVSYAIDAGTMAYASWGQGLESEVVSALPDLYANPGESFLLKSRQWEVGVKQTGGSLDWSLAFFNVVRPRFGDVGDERRVDGEARHRGIEAQARWKAGAFALQGSAMLLDAEMRDTDANLALHGNRPTNVPKRTLRLDGSYDVAAVQGLRVRGALTYEGDRMVLEDNSVRIPSWTRLDAALAYRHRAGPSTLTWLLGVDNLTDKRAWKESPFQFGHAYLYPLAPRTWHLSVQAEL